MALLGKLIVVNCNDVMKALMYLYVIYMLFSASDTAFCMFSYVRENPLDVIAIFCNLGSYVAMI